MKDMNKKQAVYSISSICRLMKLSRAQFYNLQKYGIFPPPLKDERTGRSYYDEELKDLCLQVKSSGMSFDGKKFHLFYETRKAPGKSRQKKNGENNYAQMIEVLKQMGISDITIQDVIAAVPNLFPDEIPDEGILLTELFKYFSNKE